MNNMIYYRIIWLFGLASFIFGVSDRVYNYLRVPSDVESMILVLISFTFAIAWVSLYPRKYEA